MANFNSEKNPLVSVVIPCLNRAQFLVPTIESVLQQDYPNIECLVVDGGSTDGTIEILKSYGNRISWVSEPDKGHPDAINKGWKRSHGEILAWLNADDVWKVPDTLSQIVTYFQKHPEVDLVYGDCGIIDTNGNVIGMSYSHQWNLEYSVEYCDHCIPQPSAFIKRKILEKVNWLDIDMSPKHDPELWLRIGLVGKIKYLPVLLAYARDLKGLTSDGEVIASACIRMIKKFFTLPNLPENLKRKKLRAMSNTYLRGADYAFNYGRHWFTGLNYILKSIIVDPFNLPYIFSRISKPVRRKIKAILKI